MPSYRFALMPAILLPVLLWATWQSSLHHISPTKKVAQDSLIEPISPLTPVIRVSRQGTYYWNQREAKDSLVYERVRSYLARNPKQSIVLKADKSTTIERVWHLTALINAQGGKVIVATLPDTVQTQPKK